VDNVIEVFISLIVILLFVTATAAIEYSKRIRYAQKEFEKSKNGLKDIVLSFNRELRREAENIDIIRYKIEANAAKINSDDKKIEILAYKIGTIENQLANSSESKGDVGSNLEDYVLKLQNIEVLYKKLNDKIVEIESQISNTPTLTEASIEPVITIKRDKVMAALTDTEIQVLEMISDEGAKTAPEITNKLGLSREHTARLMKKLYEKGYLERETGKIPFNYTIKKEMEKFLKKPEPS